MYAIVRILSFEKYIIMILLRHFRRTREILPQRLIVDFDLIFFIFIIDVDTILLNIFYYYHYF